MQKKPPKNLARRPGSCETPQEVPSRPRTYFTSGGVPGGVPEAQFRPAPPRLLLKSWEEKNVCNPVLSRFQCLVLYVLFSSRLERSLPTHHLPCHNVHDKVKFLKRKSTQSKESIRKKTIKRQQPYLAEHTVMPLVPLEGAILWKSCI